MTREEYRNHVHTMVDLVMDIQESNAGAEDEMTASMEICRRSRIVKVWIKKDCERLDFHTFRPEMKLWDKKPEEIIKMLQEIKAELGKKKSSATDQSKTELN